MDILIKNGTIVSPSEKKVADILISNGLIQKVHENIESKHARIIDATGMQVFSGGIDPHVHMHLPTPAGFSADDFYTGSKAALFGGTTTFIDFVTPSKGQSLIDALDSRIKEAECSLVDYSFHVSPIEWRNTTEQEIVECVKRGFPSFKVYMAYKSTIGLNNDILQKVMAAVAKAGGMVIVHAELGDEIEQLRNGFYNAGKTEPLYHSLSRPSHTESEAVKGIIEMACKANCPLYIVHVSSKESLIHIENAQLNGQKVYAETCPQYLLLNDSIYNGSFEQTVKYVLSPPIRKTEDSDALWQAIRKGVIQSVGTDHCPFSYNQKAIGRNDFRIIPNGAGGVEHRLTLLYSNGVMQNRFSINSFVNVISTQPAQIFGLFPHKGELIKGYDADIVIWNPNSKQSISSKTHMQNTDLNIYDGFETLGIPDIVIKGGDVLIEKGKLINVAQKGKLLKRFI